MGLIRILIFALVALLAYTVYKRITHNPRHRENPEDPDERLGRLEQDPQCGLYVDISEAVKKKGPEGDLYFCSKDCAKAYLEGGQTS